MMRPTQGFTLIEFIAVLIVISILAVAVIFNYPSAGSFNLISISEQLKRDIRYTQTLAMSLNTSYTINISATNYFISPTPPLGAVNIAMPTGVTLSASNITFNASGTPSNLSIVTITVTAAGEGSKVLTVAPETGFVNG
ncbi:pilus assembly FimT family protein [Legionella quateirensis]|uniref:Tfp pilus assembly protein FimT n=1 Tax=Legionella quateirensis TaxID=45072 RepID=A0A378KXE9_9GAMM|nr:type II secretion system protein [Legionella quateirensis]KTD50717.1 hypothetical protein Lqua_0944 [Legionella quateirensis]STY18038.1 Tfp pilus assembly protein FimT [Legionella quateirensis]